jgi:peroxiredoxin
VLVYVLSVAVVVLAVLVLLDLALTAAVIRRLRGLEQQRAFVPDAGGLPVGDEVPAFEVTAVDGGSLTGEVFSGRRSLVAFFATNCEGCHKHAPQFAVEAGKLAADGFQVLPVLTPDGAGPGGAGQEGGLRELLAGAGRLVVDAQGALPRAFGVPATPSYFAVGPDGRITGKGLSLAECLAGSPS